MRPEKREYEKVATEIEVKGIIEKVEYHENHIFKGFEGKEDTEATAIRFKFKLDGCNFAHYSRWMRLSLNEKATLYKKYAFALVENIKPDANMDLDELNGMRVITTWSDNGDFQNLDSIVPIGPKITVDIAEAEVIDDGKDKTGQDLPF